MVRLSHLYMTMAKTIALTTNHGGPIIKPGPKLTCSEGLGTQISSVFHTYTSLQYLAASHTDDVQYLFVKSNEFHK